MADILTIERVGGLAGLGSPGSRLESRGEQPMSALSTTDQASVEALFAHPARGSGAGPVRDGFSYRITRSVDGREQTVEVPESVVPDALKASVKDRLK